MPEACTGKLQAPIYFRYLIKLISKVNIMLMSNMEVMGMKTLLDRNPKFFIAIPLPFHFGGVLPGVKDIGNINCFPNNPVNDFIMANNQTAVP